MTFNSSDEKQAFRQIYSQYPQAKIIELVPEQGHAQWLQKSCENKTQCDILLVSGHFGGLFFGENKLATLGMDEMFERSCRNDCPGVFENVKSVYLMGCNTLASKKRDHRNIETYLRVLVNDGFPLQNAEMVATSRYAQFGEDIETQMQMIFPKAEFIFGFDSTGPLGKKAGPLLTRALLSSNPEDHLRTGATPQALNHFFKGLNARTVYPSTATHTNRQNRCAAIDTSASKQNFDFLFSKENLRKNFDVALKMKDHQALRERLEQNPSLKKEFAVVASEVLTDSQKLIGIQKMTFDLMNNLGLVTPENHHKNLRTLFKQNLNFIDLDYVKTEQLCSLVSTSLKSLGSASSWNLPAPDFGSFAGVLSYCFSKSRLGSKNSLEQPSSSTRVGQCLLNNSEAWQDWDCLTTHKADLDLSSCLYAANRNPDPENADNMRWFCYDHLSTTKQITQPACLVLSKSMTILGNQIKSNWNCMNRL